MKAEQAGWAGAIAAVMSVLGSFVVEWFRTSTKNRAAERGLVQSVLDDAHGQAAEERQVTRAVLTERLEAERADHDREISAVRAELADRDTRLTALVSENALLSVRVARLEERLATTDRLLIRLRELSDDPAVQHVLAGLADQEQGDTR